MRIAALDNVRGLVIMLMALDHGRDFFTPLPFNPLDSAHSSTGWFLTRLVTHLCAPTFILLAGLSIRLRGVQTTRRALALSLMGRGLLLISLECTWISFSWQFATDTVILQVIWVIGVGFIMMSGLIYLPAWCAAVLAAALILPHNLLDGIQPSLPSVLWMLWHQGGDWDPSPKLEVIILYPLMPWLGLMAAGYALGKIYGATTARRQSVFALSGLALLVSFILLRSLRLYGDPKPFQPALGWMSWVDVHKYPPSLHYLCLTLGIALLLMAAAERWCQRPVPVLTLLGRHAQFFYLTHIALLHALAMLAFQLAPDAPSTLLRCYTAWLLGLCLLTALCRGWERLQQIRAPTRQDRLKI